MNMNQIINDKMSNIEEDEIDLKELINSIMRKKFYFLGITSITLLLGIFHGIISKPVWEGHFQIVLKSQKASSSLDTLSSISNLLGKNSLSGGNSNLKTEVKILESPSILKPIYDFVKEEKSKGGIDLSKWTFYDWMNEKLEVNLEKGTSVLNILYRDTEKSLVIPVMNKISNAYQKYSKAEKENSINKSLLLLEKQIKEKRQTSVKALTELQKFSISNSLGNRDGLPMPLTNNLIKSIDLSGKENSNIPDIIKQSNINNDSGMQNRYQSQYIELANLESRLIQKSIALKPNSNYIKSLKDQINALKLSLSRPSEVLLKYRQLKNKAEREETILLQLENSLINIKFEEAKQSDPWRIISEPTLIDEPVSPRKARIAAISIIIGTFLGAIVSLYIDKRTGIIYSISDYKKKLKYPLLKTLSLSDSNWGNSIKLLSSILSKDNSPISIVTIGESFNKKHIDFFIDSIKKESGKNNILVSKEINNVIENQNQLLVIAPGACTNSQLNEALENLSIQKGNTIGWVFIYP